MLFFTFVHFFLDFKSWQHFFSFPALLHPVRHQRGQNLPEFWWMCRSAFYSRCDCLWVCLCQERYFNQNFKVFDAWSLIMLIHLSWSRWNRWNDVPILTCFPSHFTLQENADAFSSAAHLYEDCSVLIATVTSNPSIQLMVMVMVMVVVVVVVVIMCVGETWRSGSK